MAYSHPVKSLQSNRGDARVRGHRERRLLLRLVATCLVLLSGCHKKRAPSEQFAQAHAQFTRLYAAKLDDSFGDPQMAIIEQLLQQVPEDSADFSGAQEVLGRIREGRLALEASNQARQTAEKQALAGGSYQRMDYRPSSGPPSAQTEDGGVAHPTAGMPLGEFNVRFANCFQSSDPINVIGQGMMNSWELKDIANCRDRHPGFDAQIVITDARQVAMVMPKSAVEWRLPDGGAPPKETQRPR